LNFVANKELKLKNTSSEHISQLVSFLLMLRKLVAENPEDIPGIDKSDLGKLQTMIAV